MNSRILRTLRQALSRSCCLTLQALLLFLLFSPYPAPAAGNDGDTPPEDANTAIEVVASGEKDDGNDPLQNPVADTWEKLWSGQQELLQGIRAKTDALSDSFLSQTQDLSSKLRPFEEEGRRLLVFSNSFKGHPHPLEAIMWRINVTIADLNQALETVHQSRAEAESLLQQVNNAAESIPDDADRSSFSPEMREYIDSILRARIRLTAILTQYDSLLPSLYLVTQLQTASKTISRDLPELWKNYYLQKPIAWLTPAAWEHLKTRFYYSWQIILMRLPVEMPTTISLWSASILRFFIGLLFGGVITMLLRRRWLTQQSSKPWRHIFHACAPWFILGSALLGSALTATGEFFRIFLAASSCCIIIGEVMMAWDLRLAQYPETPFSHSPFLRLIPLALCAYALLYLPLPQPIILVAWTLVVIWGLYHYQSWKKFNSQKMQFEMGVRDCYSIVLWPCLLLSLSGLHIYSMAIYLSYVALSVAIEFSLGGMSIVGKINEHLPQEGAKAVLARLGVALAAPCVLLLALGCCALWLIILPGGIYLLSSYALKGVTVGATQFNVIQILVIVSAFYLTRTIISMGSRFLTKLPAQGGHFDVTLITPIQTAFTYITWAIFGLFALHALGMSLGSLAMVASGLSVGIGFGMQTIVNNFLSGLILIFGRTLQVGDVVDVGGTTGKVRKISIRATMVETYDNAIIYVPNSEFMSNKLTNWTSFSRSVRREIQVGVAYGSDTELVIKLLLEIAKNHKNVLQFPAPSVNFADFAASSLDFRLRFWVRDYDQGSSTSSQLRLAINQVFNENSIEISFPQLDVHLKDMPKVTADVIEQVEKEPEENGATLAAAESEEGQDTEKPEIREDTVPETGQPESGGAKNDATARRRRPRPGSGKSQEISAA